MIVIIAKFEVKPEYADDWPRIANAFTESTRAERGCVWYEWSRSVDQPTQYVLIEAFADEAAGGEHVSSDHFRTAQQELPPYLARTPDIIHVNDPGITGWSPLGEFTVESSAAG